MEQFEQVISAIKRGEDYPDQLQMVHSMLMDDSGNVQKELVKELLIAMSRIVSSVDRPPNSKFYTIMIAKQFTSRKMGTFISLLASSQLLQDMLKLAKQVDPQKKVVDKGSNLFPSNKELGNRYITLILECLIVWSERYPKTSKKDDSKFMLAFNELVSRKVVLPKEFMYFESASKEDSKKQSEQPKETPQPKEPPAGSAQSHLKHSLAKMQGFQSFVTSCKDDDQLMRQCMKYHKSFQEDMKKLQSSSNQYMEALSEDWINIYMQIVEFYHNEGEIYKQSMEEHKDVLAYVNLAQVEISGVSKHFSGKGSKQSEPQLNRQPSIPDPPKKQSNKSQIRTDKPEKGEKPLPPPSTSIHKIESEEVRRRIQERDDQPEPPPPREPIGSKIMQKRESGQVREAREPREVRQSREYGSKIKQPQINVHQLEREAVEGEQHIRKLLSASVAGGGGGGFSSLKADIQKQKGATTHYHSKVMRNRDRSHTPVDHYRSRSRNEENFNSSLSQSKVSVFELFPDVVVSRTEYSGRVVPMQLDYARQLLDITEVHGARRFKASNFKQKSLLLEHRDLQIGFKSTAHYDAPDHFKQCLKIAMFFGNKTEQAMTHLSVEFEGDRSTFTNNIACLVYANPQKIDPTAEAGFQAKQELLVVPIQLPFGLISMKIKYTLQREVFRHVIALPVTVWKFVRLKRMDTEEFYRNYTPIKRDALRTAAFRLSRSLPPSTLRRYLSELTELTDYQQFLQQKSYTEYKLCAAVTAMNTHDYLLKIRVRPDMSVVVQLAPRTTEQSAQQLGCFIVQTLQFLLEREATER